MDKELPDNNGLLLNYDHVAEYVYANLIDLGYVPTEDEVLDLADILYDFVLMLLPMFGIEVFIFDEQDELGEEE